MPTVTANSRCPQKSAAGLIQYVSDKELEALVKYVDDIYLKFGASDQVYGGDTDAVDEIERQAAAAGLRLIRQEVRHMGTEKCADTLRMMRKELNSKITFMPRTDVKGLIIENQLGERRRNG